MRENQVPARLRDYRLTWIAEVQWLLAHGADQHPAGIENVKGQMIDIWSGSILISVIGFGTGINRRLTRQMSKPKFVAGLDRPPR